MSNDHEEKKYGGFAEHNQKSKQDIRRGLRAMAAGLLGFSHFIIAVLYYGSWGLKERVKRGLRLGSFILVVISAAIFIAEFVAEYFGAEKLVAAFKSIPVTEATRQVIFVGAVVFLLLHYASELKKPQYEYAFITRLLTLMSKQRLSPDIVSSLEVFHTLFSKAGIAHVSVYEMEGGKLSIRSVYPEVNDEGYRQELPIGKGIAGRVYQDSFPRYAARLFFPNVLRKMRISFYMPHALRFEFRRKDEGGGKFSIYPSGSTIDAFAFESDAPRKLEFSSVLSVPIPAPDQSGCLGVLNFDFSRPGRLDTVDILMASIFGRWLGMEIIEKQRVRDASPGSPATSNQM